MTVKINALSQTHLIELLLLGGLSIRQLAEETGLHYRTVCDYVAELRKKDVLPIDGWNEDSRGRISVPTYRLKLGGKDAPKKIRTRKEIAASYKKRQREARLLGLQP